MPVVAMEPAGKLISAMGGGVVGSGIGPFTNGGLDEALGLAVGLGSVGAGADMLEAELAAGGAEVQGVEAGTIVGHNALEFDAQARVISDGLF